MSKVVAALLTSLALLACTPALNWRSVPVGERTAMLPCKPDRAQRPVQLGVHSLTMEVAGCEASGALFAISRIALPAGTDSQAVLAQWHAAAMASLGDEDKRQAKVGPAARLSATGLGKHPDGSPIQAHFLWQVGSREIVLLAVYAPRVAADMIEPFLVDLQLP